MKTAISFNTIILIFMGLTFYGCLTAKVNDIVNYQPKSEKLVKIISASISNDNTIDIVFTGKYAGRRKEYQYHIHLNLDTIISMNKIPNTSVSYLSEVFNKTGI